MRSRLRDRLLVRLFLDQLLEPESHGATRRAWLPAIAGGLITIPAFVTILLSIKYLFQPFQSAGWTAVTALDDQLLYVGWSIGVPGLLAIAIWDDLGIDAREAAILGPLPVPRRVLAGTRLAAVGVLAAAVVVALNAVPALLHPVLVGAKLPMTAAVLIHLVGAHALANAAAALFGFCSVLTVREIARAGLSASAFRRVSNSVRTLLLMLLTVLCLVLPALPTGTAVRADVRGGSMESWFVPLWFVGLHERLGGGALDTLARPALPPRIQASEAASTALYRNSAARFAGWAGDATAATGLVWLTGLVLFVFNARRLPEERGQPVEAVRGRSWSRLRRPLWAGRGPQRAGALFAAATLWRNLPQRATVAAAAGAGLAVAVVLLRASRAARGPAVEAPLAFLSIQTVVVLTVALGLRAALATAADPSSDWIFRLTPADGYRGFVSGVRRASCAGLLLVVAVLLPLHIWFLGWAGAWRHAAVGAGLAVTLNGAIVSRLRGIPLVRVEPGDHDPATFVPVGLLTGALLVTGLAWVERLLLTSGPWTVAVILLVWGLACVAWWRLRPSPPVTLDDADAQDLQPLGLTE